MKKIFKTLLVAGIGLIINIPFLIMINSSLSTYEALLKWPIEWFTQPLQWSNFTEIILGHKNITAPLLNSFIVSLVTMFICTIIAILAAYATVRYKYIGKRLFLFLVLMMQMFSPVLISGPLYVIFSYLGILDTRLSLIIANIAASLPMTIWLLYSYFKMVPIHLEEAARLEGCSRLQAITHIIIPIAFPGIVTAGIFAFISAWGDLIFARMSILSAENYTLSLALLKFEEIYETRWELQLAASTLSVVPIFILFLFIQNKLGHGLMQTGSKE